MTHTSLVTIQYILIGLGVLFQVVAFSAIKRETFGYRFHEHSDDDERDERESQTIEKAALPTPVRKAPHRTKSGLKPVHDYYEVEKTPANIKPAELTRTAKVRYFDNYKAPEA